MPTTLVASQGAEFGAVEVLERLRLIHPADQAESISAFLRLGLDRMEQRIGVFDTAARKCELVLIPGGGEWRSPVVGLRVISCAQAHVAAVVHRLAGHEVLGQEETLAQWFALNLFGPGVFGPYFYADMVRMMCWSGEEDETAMLREMGAGSADDYEIYTKAELIADTAPWIMEQKHPEHHAFWLGELAKVDPALALQMESFLTARALIEGKVRDYDPPMDTTFTEAVVFTWRDGHRVTDVYDEYYHNEYESGMDCDWAWLISLDQPGALDLLRKLHTYHRAAALLADYINQHFPTTT